MPHIVSRIRRHLADPESHHRRIAAGFLWVCIFVLLGKLAGAAKEMAIAWRYGIGATLDAYVFVFNLVNWPVSVWFSVLTLVLVPLVARVDSDNPSELQRFRGELLGLSLLAGSALGGLIYLALPLVLQTGWVGLSGDALQEAVGMARGLALLAPLGVLVSLFSVWTLTLGRHRNTLLEAVPALVILVALLLPPGWLPEPLLWGTVAGIALQMTTLAWPLRRAGELQAPQFGFHSPAWRGFWGSLGVMSLGQSMTSFTSVIDQLFAAELGVGAISTLGYANRILALVLSLGATAVSRATLPIFAEARTTAEQNVYRLALRWAAWMFFAGVALIAIGAILSPIAVELLFERGAFTPADTQSVSVLLRLCLLQAPFYFSGLVLVSALASTGRYAMIALSGSLNLVFKLSFAYLLVERFHLAGLVLSTCVMYVLSSALLYAIVRMAWQTDARSAKVTRE